LSSAALYGQSAAISSVAPPATIYDREPLGAQPTVKEVEPLVDWLPIWGKSAREKGFDLPLPFGVALTYTYIDQNMVVSDLRIENRPLNLTIKDAPTKTNTGVFRVDAWLLPFLNIYALVGETSGTTKPGLVFSNGRKLESVVDYHRPSYGGGMTVAGGWKSLFVTADMNWTTGPIISRDKGQIGEEPIQTFTFAPRAGILMSSGKLGTGSIWVGGMAIVATSEIRDHIDLGNHPLLERLIGQNSIEYSVHVVPKDEWNLLIGGHWEFNKRWSATAEIGGVMDRFHVITSVMWRF
jgi:hypothetical protein